MILFDIAYVSALINFTLSSHDTNKHVGAEHLWDINTMCEPGLDSVGKYLLFYVISQLSQYPN